jgi:hypothetical protein
MGCYFETKAICSDYDACEGTAGTSVLRIVRLLRIVKLLCRFTSLQKQLAALTKTASKVLHS